MGWFILVVELHKVGLLPIGLPCVVCYFGLVKGRASIKFTFIFIPLSLYWLYFQPDNLFLFRICIGEKLNMYVDMEAGNLCLQPAVQKHTK